MAERALPDLKSRLIIDTTSLPAAATEAKAFSESLTTGFGEGTKAAQTLESQLKSSTAGIAQTGAASQVLGTQLEGTASRSEALSQKLSGLQVATSATGLAGAETGAVMGDLAAAQAKTTEATASTTDAMALSASALTELAAVDATLGEKKKVTTAAVKAEGGAVEKATEAHEAHVEALKKGIAATGEFGEAGVQASERMGALASILGPAGGVSVGLAALVIGVGAAAAVAMSATESYLKFGEEVLQFQRVSGLTAEASSQMVDVLNQFGISAEVGDKAMVKLAKSTEEVGGKLPATGKALEALGVVIAKNADGSTDLSKTLGNVADAYNASSSAAQRDTIATAAFGKGGAALIPVLEQGSAGLDQMASSAQRMFDQQQLEQVHQFTVAQAQAGQEIGSLTDKIAGPLLGALNDQLTMLNTNAAAFAYASSHMDETRGSANGLGDSFLQLYLKGGQLSEQQRADAAAAQAHTAAMKELDNQLRQTEQDQSALYTSDQSLISSTISKQRADLSVTTALKALGDETLKDSEYADKHAASIHAIEAAQDKLTTAVKAYGPTSDQAVAAQDALNKQVDAGRTLDQQYGDQAANLSRIQLDVTDAMVRSADATVTLAEKTAEAGGSTVSASEKAQIFRQALVDEEKQLAPDSPLRVALDAYIAQLDNIPRSVTTTIGVTGSPAAVAAGYQNPGRQHGGSVIPGGVYTVGEAGPETLVMGGAGGGWVIPHAAPNSSAYTINQYINGTGMNPEMVAELAAARLSRDLASV